MIEIVKSFVPDKTPQQIEREGGQTQFLSWQRILLLLQDVCTDKQSEEITGMIANNTGIVVVLRKKKESAPINPPTSNQNQ